jgi:hypothetical protein
VPDNEAVAEKKAGGQQIFAFFLAEYLRNKGMTFYICTALMRK